jgi:hypothetical protein
MISSEILVITTSAFALKFVYALPSILLSIS